MTRSTTPSGRTRPSGPAGTRMRYGENGRGKLISTGGAQWSDEAEEQFFNALAASCNVKRSAEQVGFSVYTVYYQRRTRPEFAARWQAALDQGYARIEMALVEAAADTLDGVAFDPERPIPRMTIDQAMRLIDRYGRLNRGESRGPGRPPRRRTLDEVRASIIRKLEAIENARGQDSDGV